MMRPEHDQLRDLADRLSRVALTVATACYSIGVLIIGSHLARYGVVVQNLFQARYVMAGALWASLLLISYFVGARSKAQASIAWNAWHDGDRTIAGTATRLFEAFGWPTFGILVVLSIISDGELLPWKRPAVTLWTIALIILTCYQVSLLRTRIERLLDTNYARTAADRTNAPYTISFTVLGLVISIFTYAFLVFPYISLEFGGGQEQWVVCQLTKDGRRTARQLGLLSRGSTTEPLSLVTEDADTLVVVPPHKSQDPPIRAIVLPKRLISSYAYLAKRDSGINPDRSEAATVGSAEPTTRTTASVVSHLDAPLPTASAPGD